VLHALHHLTAGGGIQAAAPTDLRAWRGTLRDGQVNLSAP
jgi:hypothetical protein